MRVFGWTGRRSAAGVLAFVLLGGASDPEQVAWSACAEAVEPTPCTLYLVRYPDGSRAALARSRRDTLRIETVAIAEVPYIPFSGLTSARTTVDAADVIRACDEQAAHPGNDDTPDGIGGMDYEDIRAARALPACLKAAELAPQTLRLRYQLARARQSAGQGKTAAAMLTALAEEDGYAPAMNSLGLAYQRGLGVDEDERQAAQWFRKAAEGGFVPSMVTLGWIYQSGTGFGKDNASAFKWYDRAAKAGSPDAMHSLGFMYANGWGAQKDSETAAQWFEASAKTGHLNAMAMTGWLYHVGRGVEKDLASAFEWYMKAAELDHPSAIGAIGGLYDSGFDGMNRSPEKAAAWLIDGVKRGHKATRLRLTTQPNTLREDTRREIQRQLEKLGYDPGPIDGVFGEKTREAIVKVSPKR